MNYLPCQVTSSKAKWYELSCHLPITGDLDLFHTPLTGAETQSQSFHHILCRTVTSNPAFDQVEGNHQNFHRVGPENNVKFHFSKQ